MKLFFLTISAFCATTFVLGQANTKLSNLVSPTAVNQSLMPSSTNSKDLGSSSLNWRNVYFKGTLYKGSQRILSNGGIGNTFVGIQSGLHNSTGTYNTAVGDSALLNNTTGFYNTAIGYQALDSNTTGYENTATGFRSLFFNTFGIYNAANGSYALYRNTTGYNNTASGNEALFNTTSGYANTAIGYQALYHNIAGYNNTASGSYALFNNTGGRYNAASGYQALYYNTTGNSNTASGYGALYSNTNANANTANGNFALYTNTTGYYNTAMGTDALYANTTGSVNTASGYEAMYSNTTGDYNTASGYVALGRTTAAYYNTAFGYNAGGNYDNGWNNVFVGAYSDVNGAGYYNVIALGEGAVCTAPSQVTVGNSSTNSYRAYNTWSNISDGRFKKNIKENVSGLSFINKLRPITYTLDASGLDAFLNKGRGKGAQLNPAAKVTTDRALKEKEAIVQTGFVAQDVEKAAKEANYDFSGVDKPKNNNDVYGLRYSDFVVPLVKAVQELDSANKAKDRKIAVLEERLQNVEALLNVNANTLTLNSASLEQNTPNPVSGSTTIRYHLPESSTSAVLNLTDAAGKLVRVIQLTGPLGQVNLNTSMLAAATYNYSLIVDGKQIATKRLVVLR